MKIYEQELRDGINKLSNITNAQCEIITSSEFPKDEITDPLLKVIAKYNPSNPNQIDLHYLNCILVSIGWNKNDDVFDKREFWEARHTPEDKPFNLMHDEEDIIGHMTGCVVTDREGNFVADDTLFDDLPNELDITVSAVIYKAWSDVQRLAQVNELIEEISRGEWCVSMECLFRNFDYAIVTPNGEHKVLARNAESAFLTKHLRVYGGTGEYEGHKVGRLLRNISFSGIGLVRKPANPRSIILPNNSLGEFVMADVAKTAADTNVETLETRLTEAQAKLVEVTQAKDEEITGLKNKVSELETQLVSSKAEYDSVTQQLRAMQDRLRAMERRSVLANMNMDEEMVVEMLEKFKDMDDEAFSAAVSLAKCMKPTAEVAEVTTETEETEVEVEAELETEVEAHEILNDNSDDVDVAQKAVSEWITRDVLQSTRKLAKV